MWMSVLSTFMYVHHMCASPEERIRSPKLELPMAVTAVWMLRTPKLELQVIGSRSVGAETHQTGVTGS